MTFVYNNCTIIPLKRAYAKLRMRGGVVCHNATGEPGEK